MDIRTVVIASIFSVFSALYAHAETAQPQAEEDKYETKVVGKKPGPDSATPVVTVDEETLERSTRTGLPERLSQEVPGLYVNARGAYNYGIASGAAGSFRMRGLGGSPNTEVLIVEDGVPDMMGIFGHPIPDAYQTAFVRQVQVVPGGDSVLFGSGAMAAAILMETKWPEEHGEKVRLLGEGGSFYTVRLEPALLGRRGSWDYAGIATLFHSDGHRPGAGSGLGVTLLKARWRISERFSLEIRQRSTFVDGADPGPISNPYYDHWFRVRRFNQAIAARYSGEAFSASVTAFANVGRHRLYDGFKSTDLLSGLLGRTDIMPISGLVLTGGLDMRVTGGQAQNLISAEDFGEHYEVSVGGFFQASWEIWQRLTLVAGARLQWHESYGFLPLFKGGISLKPWRNATLYARTVQNYRDPTIMEMYLPFPKANPGLKPERALSTDFGFTQDWPGVVQVSVGGFRLDVWDFIRLLGAYPSFVRENVDRITNWGIEGSAAFVWLRPVSFRVSASHVWRGHYTAQNPDTKVNATVDAQVGSFGAAISLEWVAGLYQKDYWQEPLKDVVFLDLRVDYKWLDGRGRAYLVIRNLANKNYSYIKDYPMPRIHGVGGIEVEL